MHHSREHCIMYNTASDEKKLWTSNKSNCICFIMVEHGSNTGAQYKWENILNAHNCVHMYSTSHVLFLLLYLRILYTQLYYNNQYERNSMCKCNPRKKYTAFVMLFMFVHKERNKNTILISNSKCNFLGLTFMPRTRNELCNSIKVILGSVVFSVEYSSNELTADDIHKDS